MHRSKPYSVYIATNTSHHVLYVGVTGDLVRRMLRHRAGTGSSFCRRYRIWKLVHAEHFDRPRDAIAREKQLKGGSRRKKLSLIEGGNQGWADLAVRELGLPVMTVATP